MIQMWMQKSLCINTPLALDLSRAAWIALQVTVTTGTMFIPYLYIKSFFFCMNKNIFQIRKVSSIFDAARPCFFFLRLLSFLPPASHLFFFRPAISFHLPCSQPQSFPAVHSPTILAHPIFFSNCFSVLLWRLFHFL